jgi:hypothetical protein
MHEGSGPEASRRDPLRVFCAACRHTEFVHCDVSERRCLYSECECGEFTLQTAA